MMRGAKHANARRAIAWGFDDAARGDRVGLMEISKPVRLPGLLCLCVMVQGDRQKTREEFSTLHLASPH